MASTIIGSSIVIDGEITGDEALVVQGTVKGKINVAEGLAVESGGTIEADIDTQALTVSGRVTGNVSARERVEIRTGGRMVGDIRAPRITIADGATFKGNVDMEG
jgi:cytoskeletal protein CcmA (bactofilin family)